MDRIRLLLVDDHPLFRQGVARLLASQPDMQVVGEAGDGEEALAQALAGQPDVILMDIYMPRSDGLAAVTAIKAALPRTRIIILTVSEEDASLLEAIKRGAEGYLLKKIDPPELYRMVRRTAAGEASLAPASVTRIVREFARLARAAPPQPDPVGRLSAREREVLTLLARGCSNKEIAQTLHVSVNTVRNHVRQILEKLGLRNRVEAAALAARQGLENAPGKAAG